MYRTLGTPAACALCHQTAAQTNNLPGQGEQYSSGWIVPIKLANPPYLKIVTICFHYRVVVVALPTPLCRALISL